jgi:hypothetical protein
LGASATNAYRICDFLQVQDIVVGNKQFADGARTNDIASLLLNDDEMALIDTVREETAANVDAPLQSAQGLGNIWQVEGDDFFGQATSAQAVLDAEVTDEINEFEATGGASGTGTSTPLPIPLVKKKKTRAPRGSKKNSKHSASAGMKFCSILQTIFDIKPSYSPRRQSSRGSLADTFDTSFFLSDHILLSVQLFCHSTVVAIDTVFAHVQHIVVLFTL